MCLIISDFGNSLRKLSYNSFFDNYTNAIFSIKHTLNTGSAFGLFTDNSTSLAVFGFFVLAFITFYVYKYSQFENKLELISLTFFASGALGNLIERLRFGYVIDYVKLNFINFPVFNFFDTMITLGVILYFIYVLFSTVNKNGNSDKQG